MKKKTNKNKSKHGTWGSPSAKERMVRRPLPCLGRQRLENLGELHAGGRLELPPERRVRREGGVDS